MVGYHRPLSAYFKAFKKAGFSLEEFDEPTVTGDESDERVRKTKMNPFVISFLLEKK